MNISQSLKPSFYKSLSKPIIRKDLAYILLTILALAAFEAFNFSTTDFALSDLLGDLRFIGMRWATLLSIAFCGIDFAGIARLFSAHNKPDEIRSAYYLFGAWFLAAIMNAILTWWGVVMAMQTHTVLSAEVIEMTIITRTVPIFIALLVWVIRVLLIGTLSKKSNDILKQSQKLPQQPMSRREFRQAQSLAAHPSNGKSRSISSSISTVSNKAQQKSKKTNRPEPTYVPMQDEPLNYSLRASTRSQQQR